jgi:glycine/D-amino acid oxidase-like deaminating enzyme/nitrite reductase/ring-hydroxylating ferredoxin subunit
MRAYRLNEDVFMNARDEATVSLWMNIDVAPDAARLAVHEKADVAVIGSGIAGLSIAYELAAQGLDVAVVDRGIVAGGMSARTSAHLTASSDDGFETLIRTRGLEGAKTYYASHAAAIDRIEAIQQQESISCNFRRVNSYLFPAPHMKPKDLNSELEATRKVGMAVDWHTGIPFRGMGDLRCLRYPRQATFHPLRYLRGVADALTKRGARLYANSPVEEVVEGESAVEVKLAGGSITANYAVVATNSPINDRFALHSKLAPYRTYVLALTIPKNAFEDALYTDTLDPYHYVRLQPGPGAMDYLIVGGADHKAGEADDGAIRFEALEAWIRPLLPNLGTVTHSWSGQTLDPTDYSAFSGRNPGNKRIFIHTGDSGQGLTHGVAGAILISQLIMGGRSEWMDFYDPSRKTPGAVQNFVAENVTAVKNFAEYVAPGEISSIDELKPGQGAILREGLTKVAAYRDEKGAVSRRSAKCTHLGCLVHWNSLEQCWDCPCHGSHFAPDGEVLNGPAIAPLEKIG